MVPFSYFIWVFTLEKDAPIPVTRFNFGVSSGVADISWLTAYPSPKVIANAKISHALFFMDFSLSVYGAKLYVVSIF